MFFGKQVPSLSLSRKNGSVLDYRPTTLEVIITDRFALRWKPSCLPVFEYSQLTNDCLKLGSRTKFLAVRMPKDPTHLFGVL